MPLRDPSGVPRSLDLAHEQAPNPAWLRQLAETLKLEAAILEGHEGTMPLRQVFLTGAATTRMRDASDCLLRLADTLDEARVPS